MGKGLSPEQLVRRVREAAEPVIASFGLMLWGIEVVAGGRTVVRVYVDAPAGSTASEGGSGEDGVLEGVSVDQCAEISRMAAEIASTWASISALYSSRVALTMVPSTVSCWRCTMLVRSASISWLLSPE